MTWTFGWVARQGEVKDIGKGLGNNGGPSGCDAEIQGQIPSFFISEGLEKLN